MLFSTRYEAIGSAECQLNVREPPGKFASGALTTFDTRRPLPIATRLASGASAGS
jgi:hypothetical protein